MAGRGVAESLTSIGHSLPAASTTRSTSTPADVRQKFTTAFNLCEEIRSYIEAPRGNSAVYIAKEREFGTKMRNEVFPFIVSLGYDPNAEDDPDK